MVLRVPVGAEPARLALGGLVRVIGHVAVLVPGDGRVFFWEPKRLRLRIFAVAGRVVRGRRLLLRLAGRWPWAPDLITAASRLHALAPG